MSKFRYLRILIIVISLILLFILSFIVGSNYILSERHHFYCVLIRPGQTLDQVEEVLSEIGEYDLSKHGALEGRYYVHFESNYINRAIVLGTLGELSILFDESGRLIGVARQVGVSNWGSGADCDTGINER
jgi:hypothetical protein